MHDGPGGRAETLCQPWLRARLPAYNLAVRGRSNSKVSRARPDRARRQLSLFPDQSPPRGRRAGAAGRRARTSAARPSATAAPAPPPGDHGDLFRRLDRLLGGRLRSLVLTENRSRILTAQPAADPAGLDLRLDRSFLGARHRVLEEVAAFSLATARGRRDADRRRRALVVIREHFETHRHRSQTPRRRPPLMPRGDRFDLADIHDRLNRRFFAGRLSAGITWGLDRPARGRAAWGCRRRRSTIQLGSYNHEDEVIRIHPALDRPGVPEYVVAAVVYHELLHAALPPELKNGRRLLHTPEFRRRERLFPDHQRAERWIQANLHRLLRRTR